MKQIVINLHMGKHGMNEKEENDEVPEKGIIKKLAKRKKVKEPKVEKSLMELVQQGKA